MKRHLIYALAGLLLSACEREELPQPGTPDAREGEIRFEIGIAPPTGFTQPADAEPQTEARPQAGTIRQTAATPQNSPRTRVATDNQFKCTWEEGDAIGLIASLNGSFYLRNAKLTYTKGAWVAEKPLYWPKESEEMIFRAYYPYDPQFDPSGYVFGVAADQNATTDGKSNFNRSDFMLTDHATVAKGETVGLFFKHQHVLIHLTLDNSAGAIDNKEEVRVKVRGVASKATIRLQEDNKTFAVIPDNTLGDITMQRVQEQSGHPDRLTFRAFIGRSSQLKEGSSLFRIANGDLLLDGSKLTETIDMNASEARLFTQRLPVYHHTVPISAGTFRMGSPDTDPMAKPREKPRHWVKLTRDFRMSKYEVTWKQYAEFLNATGVPKADAERWVRAQVDGYGEQILFKVPKKGNLTPKWNDDTGKWEVPFGDYPMVNVTWYGAKAYADWVGGRLPTEAEWEYACRAGTETFYFFGNDEAVASEYVVYYSQNGPKWVGIKKPNAWGLYDMGGNVSELCMDGYGEWAELVYPSAETEADAIVDPLVNDTDRYICKGGDWQSAEWCCRSAYRSFLYSDFVDEGTGFRVVFDTK